MEKFIYTILIGALFLSCTGDKISGTVSDTDTGKSAMVYNADLTPAVGAVVKFFEVNDTSRNPAFETKTDSKGNYTFADLGKGTYNVIAKKDSTLAFQDSVFISPTSNTLDPDTLGKAGSVTGFVKVQPNHDPRTATVQVLGTDIYSSVDSNGRFTLKPVAKGEYNLRVTTILPDYAPTFTTIRAIGGQNNTLHDTIVLTYTGVPVVIGLKITYDTLNGVVHLSWNKTSYRAFQDYLIYKDYFDSVNLSTLPVSARIDTFFTDTIFKRTTGSGAFSFEDTNDYHLKYRVAVRSNVIAIGQTYKFVDIIAASPTKVKTVLSFTTYHIAKGFKTDSASINDSLLYVVNFNNIARHLKKITWTDLEKGTVIYTHSLDSNKSSGSDTIKYVWAEPGTKRIECKILDEGGSEWRNTCTTQVVQDVPIVTISTTKDTVCVGDTIPLKFSGIDKFGKIVKWELSIGDSLFKTISGTDTFVKAPGLTNENFKLIARITDEDGNYSFDTLPIKVGLFRLATKNASFSARVSAATVVFNDKIWLIGGMDYFADGISNIGGNNDVYSSDDGVTWQLETKTAVFPSRIAHSSVVFDDKMWVIGGFSVGGKFNDVWSSIDGRTWTQATPHAEFSKRFGLSTIVFNNKIWAIGGSTNNSSGNDSLVSDIWYSSDGIKWSLAKSDAPFYVDKSGSAVVFDNHMWVVDKNNVIWNSSDGATWTKVTVDSNFKGEQIVVFDDKLWVVCSGIDMNSTNDILVSTNGSDWTLLSNKDNFSARYQQTCAAFKGKLWIISGIHRDSNSTDYLNDVWYYDPVH